MSSANANDSSSPPEKPCGDAGAGGSRRHPVYRGVRSRRGKWTADIREPGKKNSRIWLGTYRTPEMAAAAYDVACLALNWPNAVLNFPDSASTYPIPASISVINIQAAAAAGAAAAPRVEPSEPEPEPADQSLPAEPADLFGLFDHEELFGMPNLLADMAEGMLMSPPRMNPTSPENDAGQGDSLWSY